jgi:hypothetical protein
MTANVSNWATHAKQPRAHKPRSGLQSFVNTTTTTPPPPPPPYHHTNNNNNNNRINDPPPTRRYFVARTRLARESSYYVEPCL